MTTPQRWDKIARTHLDSPQAVEDFLDEYEALCRKHELCLGHEDDQGSFIVGRLNNNWIRWARNAVLGMLTGAQRFGKQKEGSV